MPVFGTPGKTFVIILFFYREVKPFLTSRKRLVKCYQRVVANSFEEVKYRIRAGFRFDVLAKELRGCIMFAQNSTIFRTMMPDGLQKMRKKAADVIFYKI